MSFLTDDQFGQFGQFGQSGNAKMKPFPIEAEEFTPLNWKSGDALYPGERGGFNREDRTLWRKDRYNAVYGRFRDKNGEYRDKSGRFIGENNMPLLEFRETKAFPGWANDPGSQFHPNDHPQVDEGFYRNPENQPGRGLENIGLRVWEDNWNEKGFPIKSEFHDFTTQPGIKEGVNAALRMVDAGQLQDKFPMAAAQALQKVHNSLNAAARQPQVENNTLYQIGELIKSAAPLIGQALGAVMGGSGAEGQAEGAANEVAGTAASMATMPAATADGGNPGVFEGPTPMLSGPDTGPASGNMSNMPVESPSASMMTEFQALSGSQSSPGNDVAVASHGGDAPMPESSVGWQDILSDENSSFPQQARPDNTINVDLGDSLMTGASSGEGNQKILHQRTLDSGKNAGVDSKTPWTQNGVVIRATQQLGDTSYNIGMVKGEISKYSPKCNIFVYDKLTESGAKVPLVETSHNPFNNEIHPPLARQWADPNFEMEDWMIVDTPQPGDVVSNGQHVGIVSGLKSSISASTLDNKIVENRFGFRPSDGEVVFRRYIGQ